MNEEEEQWSDDQVDNSHEDGSQKMFRLAADRLAALMSSNAEIACHHRPVLLQLYGCYKRATAGVCDTGEPSVFRGVVARARWRAWRSVSDLSEHEARRRYVETVNKLLTQLDLPTLQSSAAADVASTRGLGVRVSVMQEPPADSTAGEHEVSPQDLFCQLARDDLLDQLVDVFEQHQLDINSVDSQGLSALHWAADRGSVKTLQWLLDQTDIDVDVVDGASGQTALHQAVCGGHVEVVQLLLNRGATVELKDSDGHTPLDICDTPEIGKLLEACQ